MGETERPLGSSESKELAGNRHEVKESRYWSSKSTKRLDDEKSCEKGQIRPLKVSSVKNKEGKPPPGLEWKSFDVENDEDLEILFQFLRREYNATTDRQEADRPSGSGEGGNEVTELAEQTSIFFSKEYIKWILSAPRSRPEFHLGLVTANPLDSPGELVAFISTVPATMSIDGEHLESGEIGFLCIDRRYRSMRLTPVLSEEIIRRLIRNSYFQGIFQSKDVLYGRLTQVGCYSRPLLLPDGRSERSDLVRVNQSNIEKVRTFVNQEMRKYSVSKFFSPEDFKHNFLPRKDIVESFFMTRGSRVTDFCSFHLNKLEGTDKTVVCMTYALSMFDYTRLMRESLAATSKFAVAMMCYGIGGVIDTLEKFEFKECETMNFHLYNWKYPLTDPHDICYFIF